MHEDIEKPQQDKESDNPQKEVPIHKDVEKPQQDKESDNPQKEVPVHEEIEKLTRMVRQATEDISQGGFSSEGFSPEYKELALAIVECLKNAKEIYDFESALADGNLSVPVPGRHNYFAGPIKDLYYKLRHLVWQAKEVAKGDYSQKVDFLGSFSDSFNYMIQELDKREEQIKQQADEKVRMAEIQNRRLKKEMEIQMLHYRTYQDYVNSFVRFREQYKLMMGEVFDLFQEKKYDEGRLLIAKINDRMASEVIIRKEYSNNVFMDAAMTEIANACRERQIEFGGTVYFPPEFMDHADAVLEYIVDFSELIYSIMDMSFCSGKKIIIFGKKKNAWFSAGARYTADEGEFPHELDVFIPEETMMILHRIKKMADKSGNILNVAYQPEKRSFDIALHINSAR